MARIIIVDDSAIMRQGLKIILEQAGHTVVAEAADGLQAIQEYRIHQPDLVTMDVTMPKLDGINTVRNIITEFPQAGIIMVSGFNDRNTVIEALKTGAKHYIIKPISKEKLLAVINEVLCRQQGSGDGQTD